MRRCPEALSTGSLVLGIELTQLVVRLNRMLPLSLADQLGGPPAAVAEEPTAPPHIDLHTPSRTPTHGHGCWKLPWPTAAHGSGRSRDTPALLKSAKREFGGALALPLSQPKIYTLNFDTNNLEKYRKEKIPHLTEEAKRMQRHEYIALRDRYTPASVKLVIIAESPPDSDLYFYKPGRRSEPHACWRCFTQTAQVNQNAG
jgi:hypothetical protein